MVKLQYLACSGDREVSVMPGCVLISNIYSLSLTSSYLKSLLDIQEHPNIS